jgi:hypothetical protein
MVTTMYANQQFATHQVHYNQTANTVSFIKNSSIMTGDDVVDQDDRRGDLVWSNTSGCYIVLWKDGGSSEVTATE